MKVPWAEPVLDEQEINAVVETMRSGWVGPGPNVKQFEQRLAEYVGVAHAVAVSSDTAALDTALKALGVGKDDEVILPAMSYIAGAFAVAYQGARAVLADIDPRTYCIDPADVERRITPRTRAIVAVDYAGQVADYDALMEIARRHNLFVVENAAQSLGGSWRGQQAGAFGHVAVTDFHTAKLITTVDGGMLFTNDAEVARRARIVRSQGEDPTQKYLHTLVGNNYKMNDIQAAIGLVKLRRLPELHAGRVRVAERYNRLLADLADRIRLPYVQPDAVHGWFSYAILVENRDEVQRQLKEQGVDTRASWAIPVYKQPAFAASFPGDTRYPVADFVCARVLNIPLFPTMAEAQQDYVVECLRQAVAAAPPVAALSR